MDAIKIQEIGAVITFSGIFLMLGIGVAAMFGDATGWFDLYPFWDSIIRVVIVMMATGVIMLYLGCRVAKRAAEGDKTA